MAGLLRGVARTAVVAGTATAVSNNVSRRQARKWSEQQAAEIPQQTESSAPPQDDTTAALQQLADLHKQGILTDDEFAAKKQQILGI